jgi:DNA-binding NtrC family response regulator
VEQDSDVGLKLADHLAAHGYQPVLVRSIDAAIVELSDIHPRAIFVGLQASEPPSQMNVGEVLLVIQTVCPLAPVIAMADEAGEVRTQVVFRQGARRFVVKSVEFSQVGEVLQSEMSEVTV